MLNSCSSLPLDFFNPPLLGRAGFQQKIIDKSPLAVNDDVVSVVSLRFVDFNVPLSCIVKLPLMSPIRSHLTPKEARNGIA